MDTINQNNINPINQVNLILFRRYNRMILRYQDSIGEHLSRRLISMGIYAINHTNMSVDKMSRWVGFIQGILYNNGITTIEAERDFCRPLYHLAYIDLDIEIPQTADVDIIPAGENLEELVENYM